MIKLKAHELRTTDVLPDTVTSIKKNPITIILDNVLDTYNVGAIFRLADAVAAEKVYLCGETLTPPNSKIKKASINTWQWVDWEYTLSAKEALINLKSQIPMTKIIAVEQDERSKPYNELTYELPIAVIVGNETTGVSREVLNMADIIVELPMWGVNKSLNVMVSLGIVLYKITEQCVC